MKRIYTLLLALACIQLTAQEFPYSLEYQMEPYQEFSDGTDAAPFVWDDPVNQIPLGFDFLYFGETVDAFFLTGLGGAMSDTDDYYATQNLFMPYSSDVIDIGDISGEHTSIISYKTTGTAPNRVCHIQWQNCGFYSEVVSQETSNNIVNFQVRLYEGTNDIAIHFGPHTITDNDLVHDGNSGPSMAFFDSVDFYNYDFGTLWVAGGSTTDPNVVMAEGYEAYYYYEVNPLDGNPADGTLYYFSTGMVDVTEVEMIDLEVFPNPAEDALSMTVPQDLADAPYSLSDVSGKVVLQGYLEEGVQQLDLTSLQAGVYTLQGGSDALAFTERIVKH